MILCSKAPKITTCQPNVDVNLKPWLVIKSGYYIVPSPSTVLVITVVGVCNKKYKGILIVYCRGGVEGKGDF